MPIDEVARQRALERYAVLDTPSEPAFDRITNLAARLFNVPVCLVSLVDSDRQWFKSHHGLDVCETPRKFSFCAHAIHAHDVMVVPDATLDARFFDNPLVTGEPYIRFYAGAPLVTSDGQALGSLCIIDIHPRVLSMDEHKTLEDLAAVVVGILEHRLAAQNLVAESKARHANDERLRLLESVAVTANDAILITEAEPIDQPGPRILYANEAYHRMSGYTSEEIIGQTPRILQGEGTSEEARAQIRRALKRWKPVVVDILNYKKDGTPFWVELSITPVVNEQGWYTHWVSIQRDITERRATHEALLESEGRYHHIAANVPGMVYQCVLRLDQSFDFTFVSEGCRDIYGLEPEQIMADASLVMKPVHPDDMRRFTDSVADSARTLEAWEWQGRVLLPGHELKWVRGRSRPRREDNGQVIWDGILFDVTEVIRNTHVLQEAKSEAEAARVEAEIARGEAERANAAKSSFLSRMSHELRTPLNAVLGFAQIMQEDAQEGLLNDEHGAMVNDIHDAGKHLLTLINEVLDIARIEEGYLTLVVEPVCLNHVIQDSLALIAPLAAQHQITIQNECATSDLCWVLADCQRLGQVLLNLLVNAVKYNRAQGTIRIDTVIKEDFLRVNISDEGEGISEAQLALLFSPFERLGAEQTNIEGTGLGLSLSKSLIEAMDGTIDVESVKGQGSTFWFELLLSAPPQMGQTLTCEAEESFHEESSSVLPASAGLDAILNTLRAEEIGGVPCTILYIEDNATNFKLVADALRHRTHTRLLHAVQGSEGYHLAVLHQPDLILLDLNLPDISGEDILRALREDESTRGLPIVVLSADATSHQIARLMEQGAHNYLTKPLELPRLFAVIDDTLSASLKT